MRSASAAAPSEHIYNRARARRSSLTTDSSFDGSEKSMLPGFITKLFPSKKPERGGTLREHGSPQRAPGQPGTKHVSRRLQRKNSRTDPYQSQAAISRRTTRNESSIRIKAPGAWPSVTESKSTIYCEPGPPVSTSHDAFRGDNLIPEIPFQKKIEVHRLRKDLKDSGDYLGVQGINPETGQLDVLTPTTGSKSTLSSNSTSAVPGGSVQSSMERYERGKDRLRRQQSLIRWRKDTGQWSSVAEPGLSPIAQSMSSTPRHPSPPPKDSPDHASTAPDPRRDMDWGLAGNKLTDEHESESGDSLLEESPASATTMMLPTPEVEKSEIVTTSEVQGTLKGTLQEAPAPIVSQDKVSKPESVCTPTITTTGSAMSQPLATSTAMGLEEACKEPAIHGTHDAHHASGTNGNTAGIQATSPQHEALFDVFPPECEIERLVELDRPPSRDSHARYYFVEASSGDEATH
ncbi:hypothetical protein SEUCBS140593_003183 [Sporothrix eucalyptigena]|uniref:Uncharacterized protein n=1 Tax=Sporothrix eucalyptigena TaxID=1812306 RepID=A0ABP0BDK3_9PEZI